MEPDLHNLPRPLELSLDVFLTFSWTSQLTHLPLRVFLASNLPKRLSRVGVLAGRSKKTSKEHCTGVSLFTKAAKRVGMSLQNTHSGTLSGLTGLAGFWPRSASQTLPSTRAGGQDDVSSQANSFKLTNSLDFLRTSFDFLQKKLGFPKEKLEIPKEKLGFPKGTL